MCVHAKLRERPIVPSPNLHPPAAPLDPLSGKMVIAFAVVQPMRRDRLRMLKTETRARDEAQTRTNKQDLHARNAATSMIYMCDER